MARRSPRNHAAQTSISHPPNLRVKAAVVNWSDDSASLECGLLVALESNLRWRRGLFSVAAPAVKARYYAEIAQALFAGHPELGVHYLLKPSTYAKAIKEKVDSLPSTLAATQMAKSRNTRHRATKIANEVSQDHLRLPWIWRKHRLSRKDANWAATLRPRLPLEIQLLILQHFLHHIPPKHPSSFCACNALSPVAGALCTCEKSMKPETPSALCLNFRAATITCLVNRTWYTESTRWLYQTVVVSKEKHYPALFTNHGPLHIGQAGERTKVLKLLTPPQTSIQLCVHRAIIPYVQFDFGSSRVFFDKIDPETGRPLQELGRTTARISALATSSVPLYQLTMCLQTAKLRLYISDDHPVDGADDVWQDLIAGHVAALRMMKDLEHLVLDAELYLVLLPTYFKTWCRTDMWRQVLDALKSESKEKMATFFDETHITTLTFVGSHVPTLAFLARISQAPKVRRINLAGWKTPTPMPQEWLDFLEDEKRSPDGLCHWVEGDPDNL